MRYTVDKEAREAFRRQGYVELEGILPPDRTLALQNEIRTFIRKRWVSPSVRSRPTAEEEYLLGRDLWRERGDFARIVCQKAWASVAAELLQERTLRLAYDQFIPCSGGGFRAYEGKHPSPYTKLLVQESSIAEVSCIQEVVGGWLLRLGPEEYEKQDALAKPGNGLFFRGDAPISFSSLPADMLMIVYAKRKALYQHQPADPHTHALKRRGYIFGEYLRDSLHPLLYR